MKRLFFLRRLALPALVLLFLAAAALAACSWWLDSQTGRFIYSPLRAVPARPVGIVFGAMVYPDGSASAMLIARVRAGAALYKAGKVKTLLLTGNDSGPAYNEIAPMKALALQLGVPEKAILVDGRGYRTYDSCYRATRVYHVKEAILVTQRFHLPRALYLARSLGIDAVGYPAAPPPRPFTRFVEDFRERLAVPFALLDARLRRHPGFP